MSEKQDIDLKPCPFCGGKAELFKFQRGGTDDPDPDSPMFTEYGASVKCLGCGCKTEAIWKTYYAPNYIDAVIAVWNRRTNNG